MRVNLVSVGGWIVEFMIKARHGGEYESGLIPTGFWAGVTVGRILLGFANEYLGTVPFTSPNCLLVSASV